MDGQRVDAEVVERPGIGCTGQLFPRGNLTRRDALVVLRIGTGLVDLIECLGAEQGGTKAGGRREQAAEERGGRVHGWMGNEAGGVQTLASRPVESPMRSRSCIPRRSVMLRKRFDIGWAP